ncbi:uncharacterized protein EDB93DRAFT_1149219 [Suillus bovinus]|uniref:uncharacterized protein n=1 Tax=Suillus bovinus TaxID=48563 RepID=UPI001B879B67|nr:uncharacterized protein EDB93DRAFT_1149219 [Suillus bovinus]KAG2146462.1 hypothetical protein EDB93DRAFT_1149219 [Suillus bovinus]
MKFISLTIIMMSAAMSVLSGTITARRDSPNGMECDKAGEYLQHTCFDLRPRTKYGRLQNTTSAEFSRIITAAICLCFTVLKKTQRISLRIAPVRIAVTPRKQASSGAAQSHSARCTA